MRVGLECTRVPIPFLIEDIPMMMKMHVVIYLDGYR